MTKSQKEREFLISCSGYHPEGTVYTRGLRIFEAEFNKASERAALDVIPNITARGHKAAELLGMVARGEIDLCYFNTSYLVEEVPSLRVFDLPFVVSDRNRIFEKCDGLMGRLLAEELERLKPYSVLNFWDNGFRHISNWKRPITKVADCAGLKFRTVDSALHQDIFRALGFEPRHIDVRDLPEAVENKSVDAQENPLTNTLNLGVYRTQVYQSLTHHFFGPMVFIANRERFDALPNSVQDDLRNALGVATRVQRALAIEADVESYQKLKEAGCHFVGPDELDMVGFRSAVQTIYQREIALVDNRIKRAFEE